MGFTREEVFMPALDSNKENAPVPNTAKTPAQIQAYKAFDKKFAQLSKDQKRQERDLFRKMLTNALQGFDKAQFIQKYQELESIDDYKECYARANKALLAEDYAEYEAYLKDLSNEDKQVELMMLDKYAKEEDDKAIKEFFEKKKLHELTTAENIKHCRDRLEKNLRDETIERLKEVQQSFPAKEASQKQSLMNRVDQVNNYNAETLAFSIIFQYLIFGAKVAFSVDYMLDCHKYAKALEKGNAYQLQTVFERDKDGVPDPRKPIPVEKVTLEDIIQNGYVPIPSFVRGLEKTFAGFVDEMHGADYLTKRQRLVLFNTSAMPSKGANTGADDDILKARLAQQQGQDAAAKAAAAKPGAFRTS